MFTRATEYPNINVRDTDSIGTIALVPMESVSKCLYLDPNINIRDRFHWNYPSIPLSPVHLRGGDQSKGRRMSPLRYDRTDGN